MGICIKRLAIRKRRGNTLIKQTFGEPWFTQWEDWWNCTGSKSCTETWSQPTYSSTRRVRPSWEISTYPKLPNRVFCTLKQALLTTPVPKSGTKNPTTQNLISGPWESSSMKWLHLRFLSRPKIWKDWQIPSLRASSTTYLSSILRIYGKSLTSCSNLIPPKDQAPKNFVSLLFSRKKASKLDSMTSMTLKLTKCSTQ